METKVKRRLTTLLCADVAGYTQLMEADETGTLETLRRYRGAMTALVERHDGRVVNTWGDAVIAEFSSVVEAVQCAVETQQEVSTYNSGLPEARRMRFRIGVHLGDVMVEGDDVYGDGVNIAARLQERAEPGGILISGPVYDQVHNKLSIAFDCLGQQHLKNVVNPVTGYRVHLLGGAATPPPASPPDDRIELAPRPRPPEQVRAGLASAWDWYRGLPRASGVLIAIAAFVFLINVFSGFHEVWFHWPVAALLLIAFLRAAFPARSSIGGPHTGGGWRTTVAGRSPAPELGGALARQGRTVRGPTAREGPCAE